MTDPAIEESSKRSRAAEKAGEVLEKAGDAFGAAAGKAGVALHDAAGRAGDAIGDATEKAQEATEKAITRIRNNATLPAERGTTTIANEVVEKIAGIAAREVPGVYDLGGNTARMLSSLKERIGMGDESKAQGVSVKLDGKQADLSLTLVVEYGVVIQPVCDQVREKAIAAVENYLGLEVTNVDILVDDVHTPEPAGAPAA